MFTGTEIEIAKIAGPSVIRAIGDPAGRRATRTFLKHRLKKELHGGSEPDEIANLLAELTTEQAAAVTSFINSTEFAHIATEITNYELLGTCGKKASNLYDAARSQVRMLLELEVDLEPTDLEALVDVLIASLTTVVSRIAEAAGRSIPASTKAALLKTYTSQINSAMTNCDILSSIAELSSTYAAKQQIRLQIKNVYGTMRLPHAGTTRKVPYDKLYVQPKIELQTVDPSSSGQSINEPSTVDEVLETFVRVVLLGDPGGGKSTLSLKLAYDTALSDDPARPTVPFLVILREYATELTRGTKSLINYLYEICTMPLGVEVPRGSIEYLLLNGHALVIFDGLDELLDTSLRRKVVEAVEAFAYMYPTTQILVTSRRLGYSDAPLDADLFQPASLREFSRDQVRKYVVNWFELDDSVPSGRKSELERAFLADSEFVQDLRINPLMLSLMCGIYGSEHYIPRNRPDVYEKCALLLFDRWDKQRGIISELAFDAHVQGAMRALALWMYPQQSVQTGISRQKLVKFMTEYLLAKRFESEEESENAATGFIDFCKGRAWVLTDVGSDLYGFTHRTFLEYFAASQIVRLNPSAEQLFRYLVPWILSGGWEVVSQLALQIGNKTVEDCADDFLDLLCERVRSSSAEDGGHRLLQFAAQSLTYIVPRPAVLRSIVNEVIEIYSGSRPGAGADSEEIVYLLLSAAPENWPLVSKYLYEKLVAVLTSDPENERALWLGLMPDALAFGGGSLRTNYGGSTKQTSFWAEERDIHRPELSEWTTELSRSHVWVAVNMLEHGELRVEETLRRFGPVNMLSDIQHSPVNVHRQAFVDRIILTLGRDEDIKLIVSSALTVDRIDEIRAALIALPLPESVTLPGSTFSVIPWLAPRIEAGAVENRALTSILFFALVLAGGADDRDVQHGIEELEHRATKKHRVSVLRTLFAGGDASRGDKLEQLISAGVERSTANWLVSRVKWIINRVSAQNRPASGVRPRNAARKRADMNPERGLGTSKARPDSSADGTKAGS
jgi:NACHT domain